MDKRTRREKLLAISTNSLILGKIFQFLNARDLSSCAQVCSLWYKIANTEKKRRLDITWMFAVGPCGFMPCEEAAIESCSTDEHSKVESITFNQLKKLREQPVFCTSFMTRAVFERMDEFFPNFGDIGPTGKKPKFCNVSKRKHLKAVLDFVLKSFLPKSCQTTFAITLGVIGCNPDCFPLEIERGPAITGYFIPEIPGVQVKHHTLSGKENSLSEFVLENEQPKCLLLLLTSKGEGIAEKLVRSCCLANGEINMAVGGAIVERTESLWGSAIAFCGPNVEAASVIINKLDKKEEIAAKLEVFQDGDLHKNKCIAYMFACVARGVCFHDEFNVESAIFSKMYPKIPIIGVFGEGEIGVNYTPGGPLKGRILKAGEFKFSKRFLYGYTTVIVLIAFKM